MRKNYYGQDKTQKNTWLLGSPEEPSQSKVPAKEAFRDKTFEGNLYVMCSYAKSWRIHDTVGAFRFVCICIWFPHSVQTSHVYMELA